MKFLHFLLLFAVGVFCLEEEQNKLENKNGNSEKEIIFVGNYSAPTKHLLLGGDHHHHHHHHSQPPCSDHHHPLVPGLEIMKHGVDLTSLDMFPPPGSASFAKDSHNGFKKPIFAFTCNPKTRWQHPNTNRKYALPVQVENVRMLPTGQLKTTVDVHNSLHSTQRSLEAQAKVSVKFLGFGRTKSATYRLTKTNLIENNKSVAYVSAVIVNS